LPERRGLGKEQRDAAVYAASAGKVVALRVRKKLIPARQTALMLRAILLM
jgi:hypothetical protein